MKLTWGSCCSGSEGAHYVVEAANIAMYDADVPVCFDHKFSCEINEKKQTWIKAVLEAGPLFRGWSNSGPISPDRLGCIFGDIKTLGHESSECAMRKQGCQVPSVDCLFIGTSCKDLSRANSSVDRSKLVLSEEISKGASAQTFRAC